MKKLLSIIALSLSLSAPAIAVEDVGVNIWNNPNIDTMEFTNEQYEAISALLEMRQAWYDQVGDDHYVVKMIDLQLQLLIDAWRLW